MAFVYHVDQLYCMIYSALWKKVIEKNIWKLPGHHKVFEVRLFHSDLLFLLLRDKGKP